jgi:hypothetical protein
MKDNNPPIVRDAFSRSLGNFINSTHEKPREAKMKGATQSQSWLRSPPIPLLLAIALLLPTASLPVGDEHSLEDTAPWEAPSADETTIYDWIVREGPFDFSGTLYNEGDEEGGRVCHPDCPSGWEDDEYDLWLLNATTGVTTVTVIDAGGDIDGTDLTLEYCAGDVGIVGDTVIGTLFCAEFDDEMSSSAGHSAVAKRQYKSFYRLSPNPSWGNDDVDYTIGWDHTYYDDEPPIQVFGTEKSSLRTHTVSGYVCFNECTSDAAGMDVYDPFSFELLDDEELTINVHTYPDPNRGNMRAWLILPQPIDDRPYIDIYFDDEEEWTFHLDTRDFGGSTAGEYELFVLSEESDSEDGMTYQVVFDQLWVSPSRDPDADYDNDGWTDFEEPGCGTSPHSITQVPPDWDSDGTCDPLDEDDDADGVADVVDRCQFGSTGTVGNDTDGDGCKDIEDACPTDPNDSLDSDGDGVCDSKDAFPFDSLNGGDNMDGTGLGGIIVMLLIVALIGGVLYRGGTTRSTSAFEGLTGTARTIYTRTSESTRSIRNSISDSLQASRGSRDQFIIEERRRQVHEEARREEEREEANRREEEREEANRREEEEEEEDTPLGPKRRKSRFT